MLIPIYAHTMWVGFGQTIPMKNGRNSTNVTSTFLFSTKIMVYEENTLFMSPEGHFMLKPTSPLEICLVCSVYFE